MKTFDEALKFVTSPTQSPEEIINKQAAFQPDIKASFQNGLLKDLIKAYIGACILDRMMHYNDDIEKMANINEMIEMFWLNAFMLGVNVGVEMEKAVD